MASARIPLAIHVVFHPDSEPARELATGIHRELVLESGAPGLRIPVLYAPAADDATPPSVDDLGLDRAEHSLVVVLADERMSLTAGPNATGKAWGQFILDLLDRVPEGEGPHGVLTVAVDKFAFQLDDRLDQICFAPLSPYCPEEQPQRLAFQVTVRALRLLLHGALPKEGADVPPVMVFVSHTKANLNDEGEGYVGPVKEIVAELGQGPVNHWYDAKKIPPGGLFDEEIRDGVGLSTAVICVVTDDYSSREWCRREALIAKEAGRPILVVNALSGTVPRTFPYLGNAPEIRWQAGGAGNVVALTVREALRYCHGKRTLESGTDPSSDWVMGTSPEALTLAQVPEDRSRVLYPDPPLGREELEPLRRMMGEGVSITTPLSQLVEGRAVAGAVGMVSLSLSNASDAARYGTSDEHLAVFAEDLTLFLLLRGLRLGYGGMFAHGGSGPNYVERLFSIARTHSPAAKEIGGDFHPIANYVGWPIHKRYDDAEYRQYGLEAELIELDMPPDLGIDPQELRPDANGFVPSDAGDVEDDPGVASKRRYAWARSMTAMRRRMNEDLSARIAVGGKIEGYSGLLPGVLEESLFALRAGKALYLAGAFGGAGRLVVDLLDQKQRDDFSTKALREKIPNYDRTMEVAAEVGHPQESPEDISAELKALGADGPASALNNGLNDDENREVFYGRDPMRLAELVIRALGEAGGEG